MVTQHIGIQNIWVHNKTSTKCQKQTKVSKNISAYLFAPLIKSAPPYPGDITTYWYSKQMST